MTKVIYKKEGVSIVQYNCGIAGVCYELRMESDGKEWERLESIRRFTTEEMKDLVADLVELRIGREKSKDKVGLIRRRKSYKWFEAFAKQLKTEFELTSNQVEMLLDTWYHSMNEANAYGSQRNADLAYESLQQVKQDLKEGELK